VFHETSARLLDWVAETVGERIARLAPPPTMPTGRGVSLHLLDLRPVSTFNRRGDRLEVVLRYLITAWAERGEDSQALLGQLAMAAMTHPDLELDSELPPDALWEALGVPPQPCLLLRATARHEVPPAPARIVVSNLFETRRW
jgi:hypothetical protein